MTLHEQMEFRKLLSEALMKFAKEGTDQNVTMGMLLALEAWIDKTIDNNISRAVGEVIFKEAKSRK